MPVAGPARRPGEPAEEPATGRPSLRLSRAEQYPLRLVRRLTEPYASYVADALANQARLELLLSSIREYAVFMLDSQGFVLTWNPGAERIKGYSAEEVIGKHFSVFYPHEDVEAGKCEYELTLRLVGP